MIDQAAKGDPSKVIDLENSQEDKSAAAKELEKIRQENTDDQKDKQDATMENKDGEPKPVDGESKPVDGESKPVDDKTDEQKKDE